MTDSAPIDVLIVGTSKKITQQLQIVVEAAGYSSVQIESFRNLKDGAIQGEPAVAIIKGESSVENENFDELLKRYPTIQIILISEPLSVQATMRVSRLGCFWILQEPYANEDLLYLVARGIIANQLIRDNQALREALQQVIPDNELIALSPIMQTLMSRLLRVSGLDATVLLTGESGTGKTLIASYIHRKSLRAGRPFIALNCANLPRDLLESELFGHEKGAFTGAHQSRPGTIELADGGTLLLDEIGELPLDLQPKLLTFLQEKIIRRIGGKKAKTVDVRIICATNRDLQQAVNEGRFRADLFYRINVLALHIPPLRDRSEDIALLCDKILLGISQRSRDKTPYTLTKAARTKIAQHSWPGNVRELEHTLERAAAFSTTKDIYPEDLALTYSGETSSRQVTNIPSNPKPTLAELERAYIQEIMHDCEGDKAKAAQILGISLKTIYNKLRDR